MTYFSKHLKYLTEHDESKLNIVKNAFEKFNNFQSCWLFQLNFEILTITIQIRKATPIFFFYTFYTWYSLTQVSFGSFRKFHCDNIQLRHTKG